MSKSPEKSKYYNSILSNINLFEDLNEIICILDNEKNIIDINSEGIDLYGYTKDELLKMNVKDLVFSEDIQISDKYFNKLNKDGKYSMYEGRILTKSNKIKWIQVSSTEIKVDDKPFGSLDIIREITEKKKTEIKVKEQNLELQRLNSTKDKFFSIIAHDLKSPFSAVFGFAKLLKDNFLLFSKEKIKSIIDNLYESTFATNKLLENLLNWSYSQRGFLKFSPEIFNLYNLVDENINFHYQISEKKNILISNNISKDIEVYADKDMISAVIRNLIGNALKFTNIGGEISINSALQKDCIEITVKDSGIGISEEDQRNIFKLDKKIDSRGTLNEKGTGLGLIICKEFIEKHEGSICVKSKINKGSEFIVSLPVKTN